LGRRKQRQQWNHFDNEGPRTNNLLEGWHGKLQNHLNHAHPNIFVLNFVKGIVKWEHKLDTELDGSMLFNDIYRITNDTKLRNFQFKLLHHILPNNKLLHKMGIKNSALCNFCNQEEDSILHYLWGCPVAKRFWTSFNNWLSSALDLEVF
jgi:hypothetical protein